MKPFLDMGNNFISDEAKGPDVGIRIDGLWGSDRERSDYIEWAIDALTHYYYLPKLVIPECFECGCRIFKFEQSEGNLGVECIQCGEAWDQSI